MIHNDLTMRPITGREELDLFTQLSYKFDHELADDLDAGRRRPEWMWMALRGDRLLARLAWWSRGAGEPPFMLDIFDLDDTLPESERLDLGAQLVETATAAVLPPDTPRTEYSRFVPPAWRDDETARRAVEGRMTALERTGARLLVERLRIEWRPGTPIPEPSGRLRFRPVRGREELVELMTLVLEGTLDAHSHAELAQMTPAQAAAAQYDDEMARYKSPQEWWQTATTPDGDPVGFVIPAWNSYSAIIAYIGVLPAHRGNGYIDDVLAEGTRILAAQDVPRIRASTDVGNVPMARAFERAGYVNFERELNMVWS
ncbi:GNAT family N-acetyltransferase [Microtetraspora malaysiensis]|uniref:GNAT family N-acetyltransferase n=1 Tax=Microtetraspora malaysiensis TaxID=161358 RepID=UPI003D932885